MHKQHSTGGHAVSIHAPDPSRLWNHTV